MNNRSHFNSHKAEQVLDALFLNATIPGGVIQTLRTACQRVIELDKEVDYWHQLYRQHVTERLGRIISVQTENIPQQKEVSIG